ncbi:DNA polymerase III, subunit gamma and tau [Burkholderia thailandensis MSMB121]|uniref:DNA polymerase III subunit gamma/tau n=3 Tax=Burkholderia humptydooensis TaxID=430531 RepID=UPI000327F9B7|nr:DNA polymerase III subunit gamma/tau [Burkholderia humptydooensis]AGK46193.1 DNA polymerase III, subunit gamma and tau [Burkholderia thailandensis MSMB121]ATF36783.1 DNA polymerase III subunit gamma/tau [Burkholderia thailandensis]KST74155.1 DNA polymerase III subunit gamma/tau [Burkholderia humptydooensis]
MTYQVLARKWRPKDFASLVGQEHVVRALTHALDGGRLHHAYLFTGTRGVGKTTLSRIFAKALNCETGVTSQPCGVCRACREIDEGRFVDYVEMDAASNRGVDEMAALLERAVYAPVDARFKVYMIDEVHMLTNHAFNAMLKTLEEPPPHVKFILATTDPQKIPVTVLSRCLQFNLKQMPAGHIVSHLERILGEERIAFEPQALRLLARAAQGSMRDALSLTDQAIAYSANEVTETAVSGMLGTLDQTYMVRLLDALAAADGPQILAVADEMALRSLSFSAALQDLASLLHRIAWAQFAPASVLDEWPEAADLRRFSELLSPEQVQLYYQIATLGRGELGLAPDEYAGFTMTLLRMLAFEPATTGGGAPGGGLPAQAAGAAPKSGARATAAVGAAAPAVAAAAQTPRAAGARAATRAETPSPAQAAPATAERGGDASANARVPADARPGEHERDARPHAGAPRADLSASSGTQSDAASEAAPRAAESSESTPAAVSAAPAVPESATPVAASSTEAATEASTEEVAAAPAPVAAESRAPAPASAAGAPAPRATGAAAALDVLRNAGMRVSSDRGRGADAARPAAPATASAAKSAPRVQVPVPTPRARASAGDAPPDGAARAEARSGSRNAPPPWEDIPPDDYVPLSMDDGFIPPDDGFVPVFDGGPDDVRVAPKPAPAPPVDARPLPEPIPLDAIGYDGEWPTLAASLPLKGVAYQLAFNSELTSAGGGALKLAVPVPQYADAAQVAKLKAALADALGKPVDVTVEVGPARRTAAAIAAAERAKRQREAEQEMSADPFVQQLLREFGASIVEGSIRPVGPETGAADGAAPTLH